MKRCGRCKSLMPEDAPRCIKCGYVVVNVTHESGQAPARRSPVPPIKGLGPGERPGRLRGAWILARQSWRVLMLDKELLVFPLLSGFACLLVLATFIAGVFATGGARLEQAAGDPVIWSLGFLYYFVNYLVIVFFNSALVSCAMIRFRGGDPTVADGLRAATARLPQIIAWAVVAATVGLILRMLQERFELLGRVVIAMAGAAWSIATFFIVPVLVVEKLGPIDALKRSAALMKQTWGESLVSQVGIGAATVLVTLLGMAPIVIATVYFGVTTSSMGVVIAGGVVLAAFIVLMALVSSALSTIVLSALYLYAAEKKAPQAFDGAARFAFESK